MGSRTFKQKNAYPSIVTVFDAEISALKDWIYLTAEKCGNIKTWDFVKIKMKIIWKNNFRYSFFANVIFF